MKLKHQIIYNNNKKKNKERHQITGMTVLYYIWGHDMKTTKLKIIFFKCM